MKISASIYSDKKRSLKEVILDLENHGVDLLHVDCNDDLSVFDDIQQIRTWTSIPIDLHIITKEPEKYYDLLRANPVEYVTFQFENIAHSWELPNDISGKKGLAVITPTPIDVFDSFSNFDFILIMATIPGQSGGVFDATNFAKIRNFKAKYPSKSIHVDGGVNGEVSFILRNLGVSSAVSGSYLFNAPSVGHALMNLTKREMESHYQIHDFMIPLVDAPVLKENEVQLRSVLECIEQGKLGFCLVVDEENNWKGLISNADVRKGLLQKIDSLSDLSASDWINKNAVTVFENQTVIEMLRLIKQCSFPISYLPVVNKQGKAVGIVTFVNLIKGEI